MAQPTQYIYSVTIIDELDPADVKLNQTMPTWCICSIEGFTYKFELAHLLKLVNDTLADHGVKLTDLISRTTTIENKLKSGDFPHYHKINTIDLQGAILSGGTAGSRAQPSNVTTMPGTTPLILPA
jgi:hypothetical protein